MNIPEKAIEAAAKASYMAPDNSTAEDWEKEDQSYRDIYLNDARVMLEAAAPFIGAQALRDEATVLDRKSSILPPVMTALSLRKRADELESEAPNA